MNAARALVSYAAAAVALLPFAAAGGCIAFANDPGDFGLLCRFSGYESVCGRCIADKCAGTVDACCRDGKCRGDLMPIVDTCAGGGACPKLETSYPSGPVTKCVAASCGETCRLAAVGASPGTPVTSDDCKLYARDLCAAFDSCQAERFDVAYATQTLCVEAVASDCERNALAPGVRVTSTAMKACVDMLDGSCSNFLNNGFPNECRFVGERAEKEPCASDWQCASSVCLVPSGSAACGRCGPPRVSEGSACVDSSECARGLLCGPKKTCSRPATVGELCTQNACASGFVCDPNGVCVYATSLGSKCGAGCNAEKLQYCRGGECASDSVAVAGGDCNTDTVCAGDTHCYAPSGASGVCAKMPRVGEPCDATRPCWKSMCTSGKCVAFDPASCR